MLRGRGKRRPYKIIKMPVNNYSVSEIIMGSIPYGADLIEELTKTAVERGVTVGLVSLIGSVTEASLAFYHQDTKSYANVEPVKTPMEIVSATGNISLKNGAPFVHLHMILSAASGLTVAGHVNRGAKVFACEFTIWKLDGPALERGYDQTTGLQLWK